MSAVDQLLFGYRDGHTLLAGSRELTPTQLRDLLPHTDASLERADQSELVGAWIESLPGYLLARIWAAPEAPRRGAVWAHALLLSREQLAGDGLGGLLGLLRRPDGDDLLGYGQALGWPGPRDLRTASTALARAIVWGTLHDGDQPSAVLWDAPPEAEETLLALLDALPAGARVELGFRTRAAAARGGAYQVQVAETISQHAARGMLVIDARQPPPETPPAWTTLLGDSSAAAHQRDFLRRYGGAAGTRAQTLSLVTIAAMLAQHNEPDEVLRELVQGFPGPREALDLRRALLGPPRAADALWDVDEEHRLRLLCDYPGHLDIDDLDVEGRLSRLAHAQPQAALRVIEKVRRSARRGSAQRS